MILLLAVLTAGVVLGAIVASGVMAARRDPVGTFRRLNAAEDRVAAAEKRVAELTGLLAQYDPRFALDAAQAASVTREGGPE